MKTRWFLLTALLAWLCLPRGAAAVNGFYNLEFGMTPDQVYAAFPDQVTHDPDPKGAPDDAVGGRLAIDGNLFEQSVEVSCFFTGDGLSVIRLQYQRPQSGNVEQLLEWYSPHWGEPLRAIEREGSKKKVTWSWPWEGVEMRQVEDQGKAVYQRIDFSEQVKTRWTRADAVVCKMLPASSGCPFADGFCAQQDSSAGNDTRRSEVEVAGRPAEIACRYEDFVLQGMSLSLKKADDAGTDWLEAILTRRLGPGVETREDESSRVKIYTTWAQHGIKLRVVRKAKVKTDKGWTGPVEHVRVVRATK